MCKQMEGQVGLFDQDSPFGKMCLDASQAQEKETGSICEVKTSKWSCGSSAKSSVKKPPLFLSLKTDGLKPDASAEWVTAAAPFPSLGEYTMPSFGEQPSSLMAECEYAALHSGVSVSRLSQILEDSALPKYCLSERACLGILNRAERRGKELPKELKAALMAQAYPIRLRETD